MLNQFYENHKLEIKFLTSEGHLKVYALSVSVILLYFYKENVAAFHNDTLKPITALRFFCPVWVYRHLFVSDHGYSYVTIYSVIIYFFYTATIAIIKKIRMAGSCAYNSVNKLGLALNKKKALIKSNYNFHFNTSLNSSTLAVAFA